jgi:hypothetical protein
MPRATEYLHKAQDCLAAARRTQDEAERAMLMQLYEQYLRLAHYKQRKEVGQDP